MYFILGNKGRWVPLFFSQAESVSPLGQVTDQMTTLPYTSTSEIPTLLYI